MQINDSINDKSSKIVANWMGWFEGATGNKHIGGVCRSDDPRTVGAQVKMAKKIGLSGFVNDWYGYNPDFSVPVNEASLILMTECEEQGFEFSIMLDAGAFKWPQVTNKPAQLQDAINYTRTNYMSSSAYSRINGKPILYEFGWRGQAIDPLAIQTANPDIIIICQDKTPTGASFSWVNGFGSATAPNSYLDGYLAQTDAIMIPCMFWGFDDHDPKNPTKSIWDSTAAARFIDPRYGQQWMDCINKINAASKKPGQFPYIQVCTWNDYEEGTRIEPFIKAIMDQHLW